MKIKSNLKIIFIIGLGLITAACQYTPDISNPIGSFCNQKDWYRVGFIDANRGLPPRTLANQKGFCSFFNLPVNNWEYKRGWNAGIRDYCSYEAGEALGKKGQAFNKLCPADLAYNFKQGWLYGIKGYCSPVNGFLLGKTGMPAREVCPPSMQRGFRAAYGEGSELLRKTNLIKQNIAKTNAQIGIQEDRLKRLLPEQMKQRQDIIATLNALRKKRDALIRELNRLHGASEPYVGSAGAMK